MRPPWLMELTFKRNNIWRCLLCFLTPGGVPATTTETFCNSWKNHGNRSMEKPWKIEWEIHGKTIGNPLKIPWKIHGTSMKNPWIIKTGKRKCFRGTPWGPHGDPWGPMRNHGFPWAPMGSHGSPWVSMGSHGFPWVSMGSHGSPWVQFFGSSFLDLAGTKYTPPY